MCTNILIKRRIKAQRTKEKSVAIDILAIDSAIYWIGCLMSMGAEYSRSLSNHLFNDAF